MTVPGCMPRSYSQQSPPDPSKTTHTNTHRDQGQGHGGGGVGEQGVANVWRGSRSEQTHGANQQLVQASMMMFKYIIYKNCINQQLTADDVYEA